MLSAVRLAALGAVLAFAGPPTRPSPAIATVRIGSRDYVRATDIAQRLGLEMRWMEQGRLLALSDPGHRLEFTVGGRADGREMSVDGLSVYLGEPAVVRGGALYVSKIDWEHRLIPMLRPGWDGAPPPRPHVIAIDPGHGGKDSGTVNFRLGLMEKTFTLDVALRLKKLLEQSGYQVVMTRTADAPVDLPERAEIANLGHADLFLSIHFNSADYIGANKQLIHDGKTRGTEVYTFPPKFQRSSSSWSTDEDDSEPNKLHPDPSPINRNDHWSVVLAHAMHRELLHALRTEDRGEKLRHLGMLRGLDCPGILVESAFISNDAEARRVDDPAFRQRIAEAMLAGIRAYSAELDGLRPPAPPK